MTDPLELRSELERALALASAEGAAYAAGIADEPVLDSGAELRLAEFDGPLPEDGSGAPEALAELAERGRATATRSSGPRFFHFVMGGTTPAALGADWLTSAFDQVAFGWASSPLGSKLEGVVARWLRELFELPPEFAGVLVSGATMANFTGLLAARSWWAEQQGVDADETGLAGMPAPRILTGGYVHPSAVQAVGMLGLGRANVQVLARDGVGRLDLNALADALSTGEPAIVIANAGEVNAGDFDSLAEIAELAAAHGAWMHVDGAFGLFARLAPESRGADRRRRARRLDHRRLPQMAQRALRLRVRRSSASPPAWRGRSASARPTSPPPTIRGPTPGSWPRRTRGARGRFRSGPRCEPTAERATARWSSATCAWRERWRTGSTASPGSSGSPRCGSTSSASALARRVSSEDELDELNRRLGERLLADGRVFCGTTVYDGKVAFRPAIVNWQTTEPDVQMLIDVLVELLEEER